MSRARLKVAAAVALATLFILPFKVAAGEGRGAGAALGLLSFVALLFSPWAVLRFFKIEKEVRRSTFSLASKMAVAAALGNIAQGYAFEVLHAGVATTLIQMNVLFVAILSVVWLGEKLRPEIAFGVGLAIVGVVLTQWPSLSGHFELSVGVLWAVFCAFMFSWLDILSRRYSHGVDAMVVNVERAWLGAFILAFIPGALAQFGAMSWWQIGACALAAILGPGLARVLLISASRDLPAAESALLQQLRPIAAIPLSSLVFGAWPSKWEWWGSVFVVAGVAVPLSIAVSKRRFRSSTNEG